MLTLLASALLSTAFLQDNWSYKPAAGPLNNPLKGWCPFMTESTVLEAPYSMTYFNVSWRELEPEEGKYAFEKWEKAMWELPGAKGKNIVFRVFVDYPGEPSGVPQWMKDKGLKMTSYDDPGGGQCPDYQNPAFQAALLRFAKALGSRYDKNDRVPFIELGILGFWGEWHTWPKMELFAPEPFQKQMLDVMTTAFPTKHLLARNPGGTAGQVTSVGYHDDMIPEDTLGPEDWKFLTAMSKAGRGDSWKSKPRGGEMMPAMLKEYATSKLETTLKAIDEAHFSWIGPACPALLLQTPELTFNQSTMVRRMGYQFALRSVSVTREGESLKLIVKGENEGVAPFYYSWRVELALLDEKGNVVERRPVEIDIRKWLPGKFQEEVKVNFKAWDGRKSLALGIIDPYRKVPNIDFATAIPHRNGWQILGSLSSPGQASQISND